MSQSIYERHTTLLSLLGQNKTVLSKPVCSTAAGRNASPTFTAHRSPGRLPRSIQNERCPSTWLHSLAFHTAFGPQTLRMSGSHRAEQQSCLLGELCTQWVGPDLRVGLGPPRKSSPAFGPQKKYLPLLTLPLFTLSHLMLPTAPGDGCYYPSLREVKLPTQDHTVAQ